MWSFLKLDASNNLRETDGQLVARFIDGSRADIVNELDMHKM